MVNQIGNTKSQSEWSKTFDRFRKGSIEFTDKFLDLLPRVWEAIRKIFSLKKDPLFVPVKKVPTPTGQGNFPFNLPLVQNAPKTVKGVLVTDIPVQKSVPKTVVITLPVEVPPVPDSGTSVPTIVVGDNSISETPGNLGILDQRLNLNESTGGAWIPSPTVSPRRPSLCEGASDGKEVLPKKESRDSKTVPPPPVPPPVDRQKKGGLFSKAKKLFNGKGKTTARESISISTLQNAQSKLRTTAGPALKKQTGFLSAIGNAISKLGDNKIDSVLQAEKSIRDSQEGSSLWTEEKFLTPEEKKKQDEARLEAEKEEARLEAEEKKKKEQARIQAEEQRRKNTRELTAQEEAEIAKQAEQIYGNLAHMMTERKNKMEATATYDGWDTPEGGSTPLERSTVEESESIEPVPFPPLP